MYPVLFRIGHLTISTYGVLVAVAVFTAGSIAARSFRERGLAGDDAWRLLLYALMGGFLGAKLYYVILHGDRAALLSRAGFVWYGGLIGGAAAVGIGVRRIGLPLGRVADALAPALAMGHAIGHVGCFFSGDSYGLPSDLPWAVAFAQGAPPSTAGALRRTFGMTLPDSIADATLLSVHPTMLYSALALIVVFVVLWALRRRHGPAGRLFALYLVLTGLERFFVEFLRAKDDRLLWGFTTAQAIAALAIVGGGVWFIVLYRQGRSAVRQRAPGLG